MNTIGEAPIKTLSSRGSFTHRQCVALDLTQLNKLEYIKIYIIILYLVGGLEHDFYFPTCWE